MSHAEVSQKWGETNHSDPIAYFAKFGKTVDMFREEVQSEINSMLTGEESAPPTITTPEQPESPGRVAGANTDVLELQGYLNRLIIRDDNGNVLAEDGVLGRRTREATRRFQSITGITVDGIAGNETMGAIRAILAKPILRTTSRGIAVRYVQHRVGTYVDGSFGKNTKAAVIDFQRGNGLQADGTVGPRTWAKLIG
jgi:peptidoglycan hydrolase-like protein with peptidoglycan-binding domain